MKRRYFYFTALLILVLHSTGLAQITKLPQMQIIGKPERAATEFVPSRLTDANGVICAGIKVLSDLDGLSFDSYNGVVEVDNSKPGQYIVYVSPTERVLEIFHSGYKPSKIILSATSKERIPPTRIKGMAISSLILRAYF